MGRETKERVPRATETVVINASGERRIVPKSFLKNRKVMNDFGWREDIKPKLAMPLSKPAEQLVADPPVLEDPFQDVTGGEVTDEANVEIQTKSKAGRPSKK